MERGWIPPVQEKNKGRRKNEKRRRKERGRHPNEEAFELIEREVQERTQELNAEENPVCDREGGLCEEAAQSGGGESVFGGERGELRRTDRYAEAGREG